MTTQDPDTRNAPEKPASPPDGTSNEGKRGGSRRPRKRQGRDRSAAPVSQTRVSPSAAPQPASGGRALPLSIAVVAVLLAIAGLIGGYFVWQEVQRQGRGQEKVGDTVSERFATVQQETRKATDHVAREMDSLRARLEETVTDMSRSRDTMEAGLAELRQQMGRSQDGWILAEVRYLMRIANQRLLLQGDVPTALAALQGADLRLKELADPGYLPVRNLLAGEIVQLKAVDLPDVNGLVLTLDNLSGQVDGLKIKGSQYRAPVAGQAGRTVDVDLGNDWRALPGKVWQAIRQLVEVRHHDKPVGAMMAPEHEYFLYQNLHLQLESARMAALMGEQSAYQVSLRRVQTWLEQHFDAEDPLRQSMALALTKLADVELAPALPDISASLRLLRQQMNLQAASPLADENPVPAAAMTGAGSTADEPAMVESPELVESPASVEPAAQAETDAVQPVADTAVTGAADETANALPVDRSEDEAQAQEQAQEETSAAPGILVEPVEAQSAEPVPMEDTAQAAGTESVEPASPQDVNEGSTGMASEEVTPAVPDEITPAQPLVVTPVYDSLPGVGE